MKKDIHPNYEQTTISCACGNSFNVGSTVKDIHVEICSNCHPFYTGKQKLVDTARRVEKFQAKAQKAKTTTRKHSSKTAKKKALKAHRDKKAVENNPPTNKVCVGAKEEKPKARTKTKTKTSQTKTKTTAEKTDKK